MNLEQNIVKAVADRMASECGGVLSKEFALLREEVASLREALQLSARPVMTTHEAAQYLGVSRSKIEAMVKSGALRSTKIGGSRRIRREWLDQLTLEPSGMTQGAVMTSKLLGKASGQ